MSATWARAEKHRSAEAEIDIAHRKAEHWAEIERFKAGVKASLERGPPGTPDESQGLHDPNSCPAR